MLYSNALIISRFGIMIEIFLNHSFEDYIHYLRDAICTLSDYWVQSGQYHPQIKQIEDALHDEDPFILYGATIAASLLLEDRSIYH